MSIIDIWPLHLLFWVFWPFWRLSVECFLYGFVFEVGGMILEIMGDRVLEKAEKFEIKFQYLWPIQMDCWNPLGYNKTTLFLYFFLILHQCLCWWNETLRLVEVVHFINRKSDIIFQSENFVQWWFQILTFCFQIIIPGQWPVVTCTNYGQGGV